MNKHRREISIEILVGLFMFTVLIALSIFTIVLSRENMLKASHQYEFVFSEISGLRDGDNVYLRGMNVGRVKQITLEENRVHVYTTLDVPIRLRHGYKIEVVNSSMLGGKNLKIYEGPDTAELLGDNVTILGTPPKDIIEELSKAVGGLQEMIESVSKGQGTLGKLMNDDTIYNNLLSVSENLKATAAGLEEGRGTIGKLLHDDSVYNDASNVVANLKGVSEMLANGEGTIGRLLHEEEMYEDARVLMANLKEISARLEAGQGTLGKLLNEDSTMFDDLEVTMHNVREITDTINAGEGTLGKLVRDAKLYDEAALLVEDVRAAVDDLREASPITSFGSVIFGAF